MDNTKRLFLPSGALVLSIFKHYRKKKNPFVPSGLSPISITESFKTMRCPSEVCTSISFPKNIHRKCNSTSFQPELTYVKNLSSWTPGISRKSPKCPSGSENLTSLQPHARCTLPAQTMLSCTLINLTLLFFSMHAEEHPGRDKTSIYIFPSNHTWRYYSKCYKTRIYMRMHVLFVRGYLHCSYQQVFCFPPPVPRTLLLTFRCRFTGKWEYQARSCQWKTRIW